MSGRRETTARILAECLGMAPEEVPGDARLGSPAAWDSLAHVRIVLAVEEARGRPLSTEEVLSLESREDLEALL